MNPALLTAAAAALGQAAAGNATSGGPASFGGVSVGSKVVGSGTAATVPPPANAAEASMYSGLTGNTASSILNSPNLPIIALVLGAIVALVMLFPRKK